MTAIPECAVTRYIDTVNEKIKLEDELRVIESIAKTKEANTKERFDDIMEKIKKEQNNMVDEIERQQTIKTDELIDNYKKVKEEYLETIKNRYCFPSRYATSKKLSC